MAVMVSEGSLSASAALLLSLQYQKVADRQHIPLRGVLDLSRSAIRTQ